MRISFGPFEFDRQNLLLCHEGTEISLPPRVLGVLDVLTERAGQVVGRQEIFDRVWKDAFVTDTSLAEAVSFLRQALGDDPQAPRYIQTVHRRGYRFVAPIRGLTPDTPLAHPNRGLTPNSHFVVASGARAESATVAEVRPSIAWQLLPWSVAILCGFAAFTAWWRLAHLPARTPPIARFELRPTSGTSFDQRAPALAVSRDGRSIAWSACDGPTGACGLFVRPIDRVDAARLDGTDSAQAPFFSPDGRWIGFFADGKLKKIAISGGAPIPLADAPFAGGASWNPEGTIVFCGSVAGGLSLVSDQGGEVSTLTTPRSERGELRHQWPAWIDDGRAIIFTLVTSPVPGAPGELAVMTPDARSWRVLRSGVVRAAPAGPGYLLLASGADLQAVTFDEAARSLTGAADSVFEAIGTANGAAQFAIGGGTLVAVRAPAARRTVTWNDAPDRVFAGLARLSQITVSSDGRRAAGVVADVSGSEVWTVDLVSGASARTSFNGANASPIWSPDGSDLWFASRSRDGAFQIVDVRGRRLATPDDSDWFPSSVAIDGRIAAIHAGGGHFAAGIVADDQPPRALGSGPFDDTAAVFSPDGRWIAIESNQSGPREVYVRGASDARRIAVSIGGGERPSWSADGRAIYYHDGRRLLRATFDPLSAAITARDVVFDVPGADVVAVTPAGRLLVARQPSLDSSVVTLEWLREIRQRLLPPVVSPK